MNVDFRMDEKWNVQYQDGDVDGFCRVDVNGEIRCSDRHLARAKESSTIFPRKMLMLDADYSLARVE
jgi:hypothetical protein